MSKSFSATFTRAQRSARGGSGHKHGVEVQDPGGLTPGASSEKRRLPPSALFYTVEAAADVLSLEPTALRARLRRAQRAVGRSIVADLGGGIFGFKLGKSWRLRFPEH
jgi:hypothetical protein